MAPGYTKPSPTLIRLFTGLCVGLLLLLIYTYLWGSTDRPNVSPQPSEPSKSLQDVSKIVDHHPPAHHRDPPSKAIPSSNDGLSKNKKNTPSSSVSVKYSLTDRYPSSIDKLWIEVDTNTLLRRTAYYDTRPHFGRSVVLISLHDDEKEKKFPQLYAKVTMSDSVTFCSPVEDWKTNGKLFLQWHDVVLNHALRVHLKGHAGIPKQVQVTKDSQCMESTLLPVMNVFYDQRKQDGVVFATCLQKALFGTIPPGDLINFIELNKFLGASYISMYFSNHLKNPDELLKAASPYISSGLVEILDWRLTQKRQDWVFDYGMAASATECIYRNIHRAKYLTLHDMDEFLIPRKHMKWVDFLEDMKQRTDISKYASFAFGNILFKLDTEPMKGVQFDSTKCKPPVYFIRKMRNGNPEKEHPKVMLDLNTTITAYCHDIKNWKDGLQKFYWVPDDLGLLHHYRSSTGEGRDNGVRWIHDNVMDSYVEQIIPIIKKRCSVR